MLKSKFLQPFITSLVGLIPNCASSVVITETYLSGGIAFGSCVAGLCANAGMGFVILLKNVKEWKRNLALIGFTYAVSVVIGLLCNVIPFL
jgi:peptidoglycan biosynthesis protein MviN/MurJ (putative lipid II flippase)